MLGIDLTKNYTGDEVAELLDDVMSEAESSVESAWNDGYKTGVLEYAPKLESLQVLNEATKAELDVSQKLNNKKLPGWTAPLLFALGFATAGLIAFAF